MFESINSNPKRVNQTSSFNKSSTKMIDQRKGITKKGNELSKNSLLPTKKPHVSHKGLIISKQMIGVDEGGQICHPNKAQIIYDEEYEKNAISVSSSDSSPSIKKIKSVMKKQTSFDFSSKVEDLKKGMDQQYLKVQKKPKRKKSPKKQNKPKQNSVIKKKTRINEKPKSKRKMSASKNKSRRELNQQQDKKDKKNKSKSKSKSKSKPKSKSKEQKKTQKQENEVKSPKGSINSFKEYTMLAISASKK